MSKTCIKCGEMINEGTKFCPKCGMDQTTNRIKFNSCPKCGKALKPGMKFCSYCGELVVEGSKVEPKPAKINCPRCHISVDSGTKFCPECGYNFTKPKVGPVPSVGPNPILDGDEDVFQKIINAVVAPIPNDGTPRRAVMSVFGQLGSGIFTLLLTISLLVSLKSNISSGSFVNLLLTTPTILICIGCWMSYVQARMRKMTVTGFNLINYGILVRQVLFYIMAGIVTFLSVMLIFGDEASVGIGLLIICLIVIVLGTAYYNGLRQTVLSAKNMLVQNKGTWIIATFPMVILGINAFATAVKMAVLGGIARTLGNLQSNMAGSIYDFFGNLPFDSDGISQSVISMIFGDTVYGYTFDWAGFLSLVILVYAIVLLVLTRSPREKVYREYFE